MEQKEVVKYHQISLFPICLFHYFNVKSQVSLSKIARDLTATLYASVAELRGMPFCSSATVSVGTDSAAKWAITGILTYLYLFHLKYVHSILLLLKYLRSSNICNTKKMLLKNLRVLIFVIWKKKFKCLQGLKY